jgi:serine/threonine protein kinase|tara:strand:- start:17803 stop:18663 length:861 start_codon:yes stop_codon:yes gene_type:complete
MISTKYTVIDRLSAENSKRFGETFLVKKGTSEELFVLKTVEKSNEIGFAQLKIEASFSFEIDGLPKVISVEETETQISILKKYQEGISLNDYFLKIKLRKRLKNLSEIVSALAPLFKELQNQQIIHCDIKPENILVHESNNGLKCSIIDFGLAFRMNELPERKTLFQLAYSAPEIVLNRLKCADFSTDVFSFCLIAYKVLNGRLPFSDSNPALLTQLQITYPIEKPFRIKKKVWKVLEKGLAKHQFKKSPNKYRLEEIESFLKENNQKRYSSFKDFSKDFIELSNK